MSRKINVGVVGLGMGKRHIENYLKCKDANLIAICDINDEKLTTIRKTIKTIKGHNTEQSSEQSSDTILIKENKKTK